MRCLSAALSTARASRRREMPSRQTHFASSAPAPLAAPERTVEIRLT